MYTLDRLLADYDMAMLRTLAQIWGISLTTNRQTEAADQLVAALVEPLSVEAVLARLSPQALQALETLLVAGGRMRALPFARRYGTVRPVGPGRLERETPWRQPANPAEELLYAGLVFRGFSEDETGPAEFIFVPQDLIPLLPRPQHPGPAFVVEIVPGPADKGNDGSALVRDMFVYLVYLHTHSVRPYADGRLGSRDMTALRKRLIDGDKRRLDFLLHLATRLGFVVQQDEHLSLETASVKRWLSAPPTHQLESLQNAWRNDPSWNDLCRVPALDCDQETGWHLRFDAVAARHAFLSCLARCPLGAWWSVDSFVQAIKETCPDFQRPDGDYTSWYIRDPISGDYLSGFESWDRVEGALIANLLAEPVRWLGIVTTGSDDAQMLCCLTEAGARFLGLASDELEELSSPPIVVHPDFRVDVPASANLYTRFQLERFADLVSEDPCRYALTAEGLARALAQDVRVEQVVAFLQQASGVPVPANVAGQLRLWASRFGRVELEEVIVLRAKSERVLRELSALPETRSLITQVLTPSIALVRRRDLPRLRKALRALGFLPPPD
jgi:hypothetical protein